MFRTIFLVFRRWLLDGRLRDETWRSCHLSWIWQVGGRLEKGTITQSNGVYWLKLDITNWQPMAKFSQQMWVLFYFFDLSNVLKNFWIRCQHLKIEISGTSLVPGQETKIPLSEGQLNPYWNYWAHTLWSPRATTREKRSTETKSLRAAMKYPTCCN